MDDKHVKLLPASGLRRRAGAGYPQNDTRHQSRFTVHDGARASAARASSCPHTRLFGECEVCDAVKAAADS